MKKVLLAVSALTAAAALSACGGSTNSTGAEVKVNGDAVYPVECADKLTYWMSFDAQLDGLVENFGETPLAKALKERTGIDVEYIHAQAGSASEQLNVMMASNELPDMVQSNWSAYAGGAQQAAGEGYIYDLTDAVSKWAPALSKYLEENKDVGKRIKTDEGKIFEFPFVRGEQWLTSSQGLIMRKDWLDKLGMETPDTIDDFEKVLEGFKTVSNKAPLVLRPDQYSLVLYAYDAMPDFYIDNGKVKYGPAEPGYKAALQKLNEWYNKGLLDNNFVSVDSKYVQARILNSDAGAFMGYIASGMGAMLDAKPSDQPDFDLVAVKQPTVKGGRPEYSYGEDIVNQPVCVAVSKKCKNLELATRYLDYGFTEEGHNLYNFGIEGESYTMVDGKPTFTELITKNPDGLSFVQAADLYTRAPYAGIFVQDPDYVRQSLTYRDKQEYAYNVWSDSNISEHLMPPVSMSAEEQAEAADIISNINTYVAEKYVAFITGKESFDNYDSFLAQLDSFGINKVIEYRQNALDRYNAR